MTSLNRRELCVMLSALAAVGGAGVVEAQTPTTSGEMVLDKCQAFTFDSLPKKMNATGGGITRAVVKGALPTGEAVELHETTLPPGQMPHPPHKHVHSEFMMIREGTVEFEMAGEKQRVGPGGVCFAASGVMHGLKNVGDVNANYFVIAIGREPAASVA